MKDRILVVDDDEAVRELLRATFSDAGYGVFLAGNGEEALEIMNQHDIYVIFLDLNLFGVNGIELCRQIRAFKPLPIIYAMTGWGGLYDIEECRKAGFDDFFRKPLPMDIVLKTVREAFERLARWRRPAQPAYG
jgi:DNA-binding response OmpR family regulator